MQAKPSGAVGGIMTSHKTPATSGWSSSGPPLEEIRELLRDGEVHEARRLATEAMTAHPDHPELRRVHELLNVGRSRKRPATGRSIREELEPLRDPPDEYRGKWVAMVGREIVGVADSLKELLAGLPSDLEQTPLAVQIAPCSTRV